VLNPKLQRVRLREHRRLRDGEFSWEVLLVLSGRPHAVIAKADIYWRRLLPNLESSMSPFQYGRSAVVNPRVVRVISHTDEGLRLIWCGNGGKTGQDRANQTIVLHCRHVVVDFEGR
jgi:hypothetical protein